MELYSPNLRAAYSCLSKTPTSANFGNDSNFSVSDTSILGKIFPSSPNRSRTNDLPVTGPDALTLSYGRLVRAEAIKLGSCDKDPAYCYD